MSLIKSMRDKFVTRNGKCFAYDTVSLVLMSPREGMRRNCTAKKLYSHSQNLPRCEEGKTQSFSFCSSSLFRLRNNFFFLLSFVQQNFALLVNRERVKRLFKTERMKYLRLKTSLTSDLSLNLTSFLASFQWEENFWEIFSVLLSIFLIHCLRAMKLVVIGSNARMPLRRFWKNPLDSHSRADSHLRREPLSQHSPT